MNPRSSDYKRDIKLVDNTLLNLIKGRLFMLIAVSIVVLGVLYFVAKKILSFGRNLDYSILNNTAVEVAVDYLEQYDVYFWWAVVLIIALFVLSFINNFVRKSLDSFSHSNIPMPVARNLLNTLSPMALEVLNWVWHERRDPLQVNELKLLSRELKQGRFSRIEEAKEQEQLLNKGLYGYGYSARSEENQVPMTSDIKQSEAKQAEPILNEPVLRQNATVQVENDKIIIENDPKAWSIKLDMIEIIAMNTHQETFAVSTMHLVDGQASTKAAFPVSASTTKLALNLSSQTTGLLLGLLLLLIGCLA